MTTLRNYLPQSISGTITSDANEVIFCRDSNFLGTYRMKQLINENSLINNQNITYYQSVNDYPNSQNPMTVLYGTNPLAYISYYENVGFYARGIALPTTIARTTNDQFAYMDGLENKKVIFYISQNNAKRIYKSDMISTLTPIDDVYNTDDGKNTGKEIKSTKMFVVLDTYLVMLGGENYTGIRIYSYNKNTDQLSFVKQVTDNYTPYCTCGNFYQIDSSTIYGGAVSYYSNTGYNAHYSFKIEANEIKCDIFISTIYDKDGSSIQNKPSGRGSLSYYKGKLHYMHSPGDMPTDLIYYTINGYSYQRNTKNGYYSNLISMSETELIGYHSTSHKIDKIVLEKEKVTITTLHTTTDKSCVFKIPGMPILYVEPDTTALKREIYYYCSDCGAFPIILPEGSTVNDIEIKNNILVFPQSGKVDIHPSSTTLNKTFYCLRNNQGGLTL